MLRVLVRARGSRAFSSNLPTGASSGTDVQTHTGQAWDSRDHRLQRFDISPKQVNPNVAAKLVAERPPEDCGHKSVVFCDGGHGALGHPRVFINLDKPGVHACGYCGNRFYNSHVTKDDDMNIAHLNC